MEEEGRGIKTTPLLESEKDRFLRRLREALDTRFSLEISEEVRSQIALLKRRLREYIEGCSVLLNRY